MAASVSKSLIKNFREQENVPDEAIFKKGSFSLFCFSLKQILGSKCKSLSRHGLLVLIL